MVKWMRKRINSIDNHGIVGKQDYIIVERRKDALHLRSKVGQHWRNKIILKKDRKVNEFKCTHHSSYTEARAVIYDSMKPDKCTWWSNHRVRILLGQAMCHRHTSRSYIGLRLVSIRWIVYNWWVLLESEDKLTSTVTPRWKSVWYISDTKLAKKRQITVPGENVRKQYYPIKGNINQSTATKPPGYDVADEGVQAGIKELYALIQSKVSTWMK